MPTTHPRTTREVYESLAALANRRDGPTPITDDEYYPALAELICWKDEIELAERIAAAHPLNPEGAYERLLDRLSEDHPREVYIHWTQSYEYAVLGAGVAS